MRGVTVASSSRRPPLFVPREDLFFHTRQWPEGERESAKARAAGELRVFDSAPTCCIGCARQKTDLAYRYAAEPRFKGRLKKKHRAVQDAVLDGIAQIADPFQRGGLKTKALQTSEPDRVYYSRLSRAHRITFHIDGDTIVFRNHCEHDEILHAP